MARTGPGKGKGDVIVITKSGGKGSCTVGFRGYFLQIGKEHHLHYMLTVKLASCNHNGLLGINKNQLSVWHDMYMKNI